MRFTLFISLAILVGSVFSQIDPGGVGEISGPSSADVGDTDTYTITGDFENPSWTVSSGATLNSRCIGSNPCTNVYWNTAGSKTLSFLDNGVVVKTKTVTVYTPPPPTPTATTTAVAECQYTTVTRTNSPPPGVRWYWQTSPSGTSTALGYGSSVGIDAPGPIYLRARSATITYNWSTSSQSITYPFNSNFPALASGSDVSRCGTGNITLTATPGLGGNTIKWFNGPTGGSAVHTGISYTRYNLSTTTTYYAATHNSTTNCTDPERKAITATINSIPSLASGSNQSRCGSGTVTLTATPGSNGNTIRWYSASSGGTLLHTGTSYTTPSLSANKTYYAASFKTSTGCEDQDRKAISVTIVPTSNAGTLTGNTEEFGVASGSLTLGGTIVGNVTKWQYKTTGGWVDTLVTSTTINYVNIQESTQYRAVVKNGICSQATSNSVLINVLDVPDIDLGITQNIRPTQGTILTATSGHSNYRWYRNNVEVQNDTNNQLIVDRPGSYKVTITSGGGATYTTGNAIISSQMQFQKNAIVSYTYRSPTTNIDDLFAFDIDELSISAKIYDGLGRPTQQVSMNASPLVQDIVVPAEYDEFGRQTKSYLPYVEADLTSIHKSNALAVNYANSDHYDYYVNTNTHATDKAFSETLLEASPIGRPVEQGAPGSPWQLGQHTVKYQYEIADSAEVILWKYDTLSTTAKAVYSSGQLYKNTTTDEDDNQTIVYTDKQGRTILKKSQVDGSTWAETYYIYDIYGQLSVVLPPEATARLDSEFFGQSQQDREDFLNTWAFLYNYDGRNRMTMKKVPGADSVFMVYDRWDRLVLTQDGNQRVNNQWLFTKYDQLNRPILTGLVDDYANLISDVEGSTNRYETLDGTIIETQYSDKTFPKNLNIAEYLTVTYYDNYDWDTTGLSYTNPAGLTLNTAVKGQVTGTMIKAGNSTGALPEGWIRSVSYYDNKYRPIQTQSTNHLGGVDVVTNYYDFIGQVKRSISMHANGDTTYTTARSFVYDHAGRLKETWHKLASATDSVLIAENRYNELGELEEKDLHHGVQTLNYSYNIRGWLTKINEPTLTGNDLFGMELLYNEQDGSLNNSQLYNGNISAMKWSDRDAGGVGVSERAYNFGYDKLNRLTAASHFEDQDSTNRYGVQGLGYDLNGNISSLIRNGASGEGIDTLQYDYTPDYVNRKGGNRLRYVEDVSLDTLGFNDGNTNGDDYTYDANSNMTKDRNKGIDSIYYNHLNLPVIVDFETAGDSITYLYDAAGIKLNQVVYKGGDTLKVTDYVGEFIYETIEDGDREIALIQHEEGRIIYKPFEEVWDYQYHLKDHLGNVRVTFSTEPENYEMIATMENSNEAENFSNYVAESDGVASNSGTNVSRNSNIVNDGLDLNTFLQVNKRDTVKVSAYAYYNDAGSSYDLAAGLIETALFGAFSASYAAEGSTVTQTNFDNAFGGGTAMGGRSSSTDAPPAFINYLFFDREMNYITAGFKQITTSSNGSSVQVVADDFIADQDGYLMIYLSNETDGAELIVSWDDLEVYHGKTNVVSTQDYYPFGLTFNESVRVASKKNFMNTFQDQEYEEETGWVKFKWRNHQPDIGRFFNVDPLAEKYVYNSPYAFSENRVINGIELEGLEFIGAGTAAFMAATEAKAQAESGGNATNWDRIEAGASIMGDALLSAFTPRDALRDAAGATTSYLSNELDYTLNADQTFSDGMNNGQTGGDLVNEYAANQTAAKLEGLGAGMEFFAQTAAVGAQGSLTGMAMNGIKSGMTQATSNLIKDMVANPESSANQIAANFMDQGFDATVTQLKTGRGFQVTFQGHSQINTIKVHGGGGRHRLGRVQIIGNNNDVNVKFINGSRSDYTGSTSEKANLIFLDDLE
ncbi:DUF6443 domain-containing protein [Ekhidna sp. To15]|uniref:DUF6443 domain-containing protein n=1 Tax=Ekhidna sp. To15 TaxID=3395267 RepID=UPI003F51C53E